MSKLRLVEPFHKLRTYGLRAFSVCADPRLWNGIPLEIRQSNSVSVFKKNLKIKTSVAWSVHATIQMQNNMLE